MTPDDLLYYKEHEWVRTENGIAVIGISDYAQESLGDIVYVDLPEVGAEVAAGNVIGEVESVKSTSDLYTPLTGTIVEVNQNVIDSPEIINGEPYGDGWLFKIELSAGKEMEELMSAQEYEKYIEEL